MVARFSLCERRQLELAVANRLNEREADRLSEHLQTCPHCRAEIEQLAGSHEWWQEARTYLSSTDNAMAAKDEEPSPSDEWVLDCLEVDDDPAMLGRLGGYRIESIVGRGGMGIVLKAQDRELARTVAIKVLSHNLAASSAARKRFAREARAAAAVVHDHVIPIYSVDTSGRVPFLVMPYIAGPSLQDRLDAGGHLEIKEVLRIGMQTARGLAAAHAQGLVHRDIKPANILLEDGVERVRITDFGLARTIDDASQTQSGFIAGTPQYMAPEQASGEAVDARADLFSLGSVMYAMCAGHPPFRGPSTLAVLRRICDDPPRPIDEVNPDVPGWLAEIIHKLLAKSPDDRFQSAEEVATLLEGWLAHLQQPKGIRPPGGGWAMGRGAARRRTKIRIAAMSSAAVLILLASIGGWMFSTGSRAPLGSPRSEAALPEETKQSFAGGRAQAELGHEEVGHESLAPIPQQRVGQEFLSIQAWEAELEQVRQAVLASDLEFPQQESVPFSAEQDINELNAWLSRLEQELQPSGQRISNP
jgi:serine/threonine-protein kinase